MDLTYRETETRDLAECFELLEGRYAFGDALWERLPALTGRLLADGALRSAVLEDRDRPTGERLIQFGASVFLRDDFLRAASANMRPHLAVQVLEAILAGRSPILSPPEIRAANSGDGLNLFTLHYGHGLGRVSAPDRPAAYARMPDSFFWLHQGYNLREIVVEFYDEMVVQFSQAAGFHLRTDYADFYRRAGPPPPPPGLRPHRLGITRAEGEAAPGAYISRIFPHRRPRFYFTNGEQLLILRALQGDTDEEAAAALHVALPTVKSRWRAVYDRVEARAPDLLPVIGGHQTTRGGEKRRLLLNYLRQHLEELRPAERPGPG